MTTVSRSTIHTPSGDIERKVYDLDYMILCDGYQYGAITINGERCSVRRVRDGSEWELLPELGTVRDISKEGLLDVCMSFARRLHGENPTDEECKEMIVKEWGLLI